MASDETITVRSSMQDEEFDDSDDGYDDHHHHNHRSHNLSRLSMCTSSMYTNEDDDNDDSIMKMFMSRSSIESFDGDADEEFSDEKEYFKGLQELSSDSDKEPGCYSLPATPPRRRARWGLMSHQLMDVKDYASENEAGKGMLRSKMSRSRRRRRIMNNQKDDNNSGNNNNDLGFSWESDQSVGCGSGVVVITRPKGGRRSLCMGLEEVKACRDLGFELEHERMLEMPSLVSLSGSTLDTSSGGTSPIANWCISSPGDDPRDVKARLKVWAHAVALASTSLHTHLTL